MADRRINSVCHSLLTRWIGAIALLVPRDQRDAWSKEWEGELGYLVGAGRLGARRAVDLGVGALRDVLVVRGLRRAARGEARDGIVTTILSDLRHGVRRLRRVPGFTATVTTTLAIGIGGAVAIFSVVNALLLRPLPFPDADRLVLIWQGRRGADVDKDWLSGGHFSDIRDQTSAFEALTFFEGGASTLTGRGQATEVGWLRATSASLRLLGVDISLGRLLGDQDDRADASPVALVTHRFWRQAFGADSSIVGQTLVLNGRAIEIVGLLSQAALLDREVLPTMMGTDRIDLVLSFPVGPETLTDRVSEGYNVFGRLAPGVTLAQAQSQLDLVAGSVQRLHEADPRSGFFLTVVPLLDEVVGSVRPSLLVLAAAVGIVLLIACVNVANLLLARGATRYREVVIRSAMGAGRGRLIRELLVESGALAVLGGALGIGLATFAIRIVRRVGSESLPRISEIGIDHRVLLFAVVVTIATCLLFGLLPAWRATRVDPGDTLKASGRTSAAEGSLWARARLSNLLVASELGLSFALLVGAGLLVRSFLALERVDVGFQADRLLTFRLNLSRDRYPTPVDQVSFYAELGRRLARIPGVETVGVASHVPFDGGISWGPMGLEGYVPPQGADHQIISDFRIVTPDYFRALGVPLVRGRLFGEGDDFQGEEVALIDEYFADTYFPDRDPIGTRLISYGNVRPVIIGVVGTIKHQGLEGLTRTTVYRPLGQWGGRQRYVVLATRGDPEAAIGPALRTVASLDGEVPVVDVAPMSARVGASLAERRFAMGLLDVLGLVALGLAAIGVYGLVAYRVSCGARELSVRMALGATRGRIIRMVLGRGAWLVAIGIAAGLVTAVLVTRLMRGMLFEVSALDGWTYGVVATGLVAVTVLAAYLPARRAAGANPLDAIASE